MAYLIEYKPMAKRQLAKLNNAIVQRLGVKIDALAENPRPHGYIKLKGFENRYRIRVGEYRVIFKNYTIKAN